MRLRLRAAAFLALIFAGITCSEPSTAPRASASADSARISLVPRFSLQAAAAYRTLAAAAIEITEIHIVLTAPDGTTRDTVIAFPVGQDTAHIEIDVPPGSNGLPFTALIELRSADHTVLFSGTQVVIARPAGLPPLSPPSVTINYSGPGRSVRTVSVLPLDTTVVGTPTIAYRAAGVDSSGAATANLLVAFTSSDPTIATVTPTGTATANVVSLGKRGTTTITASTPLGITGSTRLTVVPSAARLVVVSGAGQTARAGTDLPQPFVVEAQGADNLPVPGTSISFRSVTAGGSVTPASPRITDAAGRASVLMTLGNSAGSYQYEAASGALTPVTVTQTATQPSPAAIAIVSGNAQTDSTGGILALPFVVRVTDAFNAPVSGVTVQWARLSGSGTLGSASSTTAADGTASTTYTLGQTLGSDVVSATVPTVVGPTGTVQFTVTTIARGAGQIAITAGGGQSGGPGSTLPSQVTARVADVNGTPLPGKTVNWTASGNGATFNPSSQLTDAAGLVSTTVTLGSSLGAVTITATSGALVATTTANVVVGAPASIQKSGDNQSATVGTAVSVPPSVTITDLAGNPVPGVNVTFAVSGGGGSATGTSATTNGAGIATVGSWTLGTVAGPNSLTATAGSLTAVFSATGVSGSGTVIAFVTQPSSSASSGAALATQPVFQLKDALGNHVLTAGIVVTASITSGSGSLANATATSAADGTVTFSGLTITGTPGSFTLSFAAPGYTPVSSGTITLGAGAAATIALNAGNGQSATVGTAVAVPPSVRVTDANGNPVAGTVVTFGVITPGATISDGTTSGTTLNVTTNASGIAALASWTLGTTAQAYTLHATVTNLSGSPVVFTANAVAAAGSQLAFVTPPATAATNGVALNPQPVVQLKDANGNTVTTAGVVITASVVSGSGTLTNATATTTTGGTATFSGLAITGTAGQVTLGFSSPGYATLNSAPITLGAGAAATIALNAGNGQSATVGTAVAVPPSVRVTDANGNPVAGTVVTFGVITPGATISDGTTSGTTLNVTTNASGIAALASWTLGTTAQAYTLHATVTNLSGSPVVFTANAVAAAGSQLAFVTPPATAATNGVALNPQPVVQLKDANGNTVTTAGVVITITQAGPRTLVNATATTDASGVATFSGFAITGTAGSFTLSFAAPGYSALQSPPVTLTAGPAASIVVTGGNNQSAVVGSAVPVAPSVSVTDASNNPVAGAVVTFAIVTPGSVVANSSTSGTSVTVTTNVSGGASLSSWTLGSTAQAYTMTASVAGASNSPVTFSATATPAAGSVLLFTQTPSASATSGVPLAAQPAIQLRDSFGNNVTTPGVVITTTITSGSGTLSNATATTNASGVATFAGLAITGTAGNFALQFAAPGYSALTFSPIALSAGSAANIGLSAGNGQTTSAGTAVPVAPAVLVTDGSGNPVAGHLVTFSIVTAGATVSNNTTTGTSVTVPTAANGLATLTAWTLGAVAQPYTMTATAAGLSGSPVTFTANATAGAAATIALNAGNGQSATVGTAVAIPPSVRVSDAGNNPVAGTVVTFTSTTAGATIANATTSGTTLTVTTDAAGIASLTSWTLGSTAQSYALTAAVSGLSGSPVGFTATATAGAGSSLSFNPAPSPGTSSGVPIAQQPGVQLRDSFNNPVRTSGVVVTATITSGNGSLTNATATSNAFGVAQFNNLTITGTAGDFSLQFAAPGYTALPFSPITVFHGFAANISLSAGNNQTAVVSSPVPVPPSVLVTDASGNPVPGVNVTFDALTANSSVSNASSTGTSVVVLTNASGIAALTAWTLGPVAGQNAMTATAAGLAGSPVNFTATGTAGAGSTLTFNPTPSASASSGVPFAQQPGVQLRDSFGNPVATSGVVVSAAITAGSGGLANATATTNASGLATFSGLTITGAAGSFSLSFSAPSYSPLQFGPITVSAGAAASLAINAGNGQTAAAGTAVAVAPAVIVSDGAGNPVAGTVVTFSIVTPGSVVANSSTSGTSVPVTTNSSGIAQLASWTLGSTVQSYSITAAVAGLGGSPVTFTANATAGAAANIALDAGGSQAGTVGTPVAIDPSVRVTDANGNGVAGTTVTFAIVTAGSVVDNGSTFGPSVTVTTDAAGVATLKAWTLGTSAQTYTMNATSPGLAGSPVPFSATAAAGSAANIALQAGNGQTATVGSNVAIAPAVRVTDQYGNDVAGTVVTFNAVTAGSSIANASTSGTTLPVTTNATGIAQLNSWTLGNTAGTYTLTGSAAGLTGSPVTFTATATAAAGSALAFTTSPSSSASSGVPLAQQPVIQLRDNFGNPVAISGVVIAASITSGNGSLSGSTATTNSSGTATFSGLTITGQVGNFSLQFGAAGYSSLAFGPIAVSAGPAAGMSLSAGNNQTATVNTNVPIPPAVIVHDSFGNPVPAVVVTFSAVTGNGSSVANGTTTASSVTVATNAAGIATLAAWKLGTVAQAYLMTGSVSGLSGSPVNFSGTATPGPQSTFAIVAGQGQTAAAGTAVPVAPSVRVLDANGNGVAGSTVNFATVPLSTVSDGSTTSDALSLTTDANGFATLASWTLGNTAQPYNINVTVNGLGGTLQFNATATAGAGSALGFTQQPSASGSSGVALASQPIVQIRDSFGNPVSTGGVVITASITSGSGTIANATATTNSSGAATFSGLTISGQAGNFDLTFAGGGYSPISFGPIAVSAGAAASIALNGGDGQSAQVASSVAIPPSVLVTDAQGNPVAGISVTFSTSGGATVSNSTTTGALVTVTTNASGIAALTAWTMGTVAKQHTMLASVQGLSGSPVTFTATATAGPLNALQIIAGDNQTTPVSSPTPVAPSIRAVDAHGNGVGGVPVTFTVGQSGAQVSNTSTSASSVVVTTNASGDATLNAWTMSNTVGQHTLDVTAPGVSAVQFTADATAAAGTQITLTQQPSTTTTSGQPFAIQPIAQLRDGFGNPVNTMGIQIAVQITSGNGQLTNFAEFTDDSGAATFTDLTLTGVAGTFNIQFVASGYTPRPFGPITLVAGTASTIAVQAGNNQSVQWGQPVPIPPAVLVTDPTGNPVSGVVVTFTPVTNGGQVQNSSTASSGPLDVTTNAQGIAALDAFYVGNQAGNYILTATAAGLSGSPVQFNETALAGPFTHVAFTSSPSPSGQSGVPLVNQPIVELRDAAGNVVPQAGVTIAAGFVSGTGTFTNGTATTDATGHATFSGFAVNGLAGGYTIAFNAPQTPGVSAPLTLSAGPAAALAFAATGSTTVTNDQPFPTPPQVRLRDSGGNSVSQAGVTITAAVSSGGGTVTAGATATTGGTGVAVFTGLTITGPAGPYELTFTSGSLAPLTSGTITVNPGAAAQIVPVTTQNQSATQSIVSTTSIPSYAPVGPQARVVDVSGNGVSGVIVTFRTSSAGAFIQTTTTSGGPNSNVQATTNASGIARVLAWQVGTAVRIDTVTASAGTTSALAGSPVSFVTDVVANSGNVLSFTTAPSTTVTSGAPLATQPVIRLRNAQGQFVAVPNVQVTIFLTGSANGVLSGTTSVLTDANGQATFTNLVITGSPGTVTLRAASPGYTASPQSYFITIQ